MSRQLTSGVLGRKKGVTPLLDLYPDSSTAYSLRLLRSDYTGNCLRVRRDSDNTEMDVGFSGGIIDKVALLNFVGIGNGYVSIWYNQGETGGNAAQAELDNQPFIVESGVMAEGIRFIYRDDIEVYRFLTHSNPYLLDDEFITLFVKFWNVQLQSGKFTLGIANAAANPRRGVECVRTNNVRLSAWRGVGSSVFDFSIDFANMVQIAGITTSKGYEWAIYNNIQEEHIQLDSDINVASEHEIGKKGTVGFGSSNINEVIFWRVDYHLQLNEINNNMNSWTL